MLPDPPPVTVTILSLVENCQAILELVVCKSPGAILWWNPCPSYLIMSHRLDRIRTMMMKTLDPLSTEGLGIGLIDEDEAADDSLWD